MAIWKGIAMGQDAKLYTTRQHQTFLINARNVSITKVFVNTMTYSLESQTPVRDLRNLQQTRGVSHTKFHVNRTIYSVALKTKKQQLVFIWFVWFYTCKLGSVRWQFLIRIIATGNYLHCKKIHSDNLQNIKCKD